jgi:hypothetical protein
MPEVDEDEDVLPELPPSGVGDDDSLPDDEELGLDDELDVGDDEDIGLEDAAGMEGIEEEGALFALDLPPEPELTDGEDDLDAIPFEGLDDDEEYGWADTGERLPEEPWDPAELDLPGLAPLGRDDGGEEGVEETFEHSGDGDDASHLPALATDPSLDDEEDDLSIGEAALIAEAALSFEDERREMGAFVPAAVDASARRVEWLGPDDDEILCAEVVRIAGEHAGGIAGGGRGVYSFSAGFERLPSAGLEGSEVIAIAIGDDPRRITVGTRLGGVFCSEDRGATFEAGASPGTHPKTGTDVAQSFHLRRERGSERLWGRTGTGALHRSDDFGRTWTGPLLLKPAVAIETPPEGGVVVLCAGREAAPQIARSSDGGERWTAVDGPPLGHPALGHPLGGGGELFLAVFGDHLAVSSDVDPRGPFLSADAGKTWLRVPGLPPTGPMALARESGGLSLYAAHFFEGADAGVVARHRPDGGEPGLVLDVAEEAAAHHVADHGDSEGEHRVYALIALVEGPQTVLYAASGAGLFRVVIDPERIR